MTDENSKIGINPFKRITKGWLIVGVLVVFSGLLAIFSINKIMAAILHSRPEVIVPKLEGKNLTEALSLLSSIGLSVQEESTDYDESLPAGTIIRQHPPSGMKVRAGRSIRVVVSKGGQVVFVPDIFGKPLPEAQSILAGLGLQMGSVDEIFSTDTVKGVVVSQTPSSSTVVTRGALVDVVVSRGEAPEGAALVPDFVGRGVAAAQEWGKNVGADLVIKEDRNSIGIPGQVIRQEPLGGHPLLDGDSVTLVIIPKETSKNDHLEFNVPPGQGDVIVRIMSRDASGENKFYEGKQASGLALSLPVNVKSTTRFRIYVDDILREEKVMEPNK